MYQSEGMEWNYVIWFRKIDQVKPTIIPHHIPSATGAKGDSTANSAHWKF